MSLVLPLGSSSLVSPNPPHLLTHGITWFGKWIRPRDDTRRSSFLTASAMNQTTPIPSEFLWQLRYCDMETASILPLVLNDCLAGSGHLSRAYCEAQRTRTTLPIFL